MKKATITSIGNSYGFAKCDDTNVFIHLADYRFLKASRIPGGTPWFEAFTQAPELKVDDIILCLVEEAGIDPKTSQMRHKASRWAKAPTWALKVLGFNVDGTKIQTAVELARQEIAAAAKRKAQELAAQSPIQKAEAMTSEELAEVTGRKKPVTKAQQRRARELAAKKLESQLVPA